MYYILLTILILTLIATYKNNNLLARIFSLSNLAFYVLTILDDIFPMLIIIKSGFGGSELFLWDSVNFLLLTLSAIFIWLKKNKVAKWMLWLMVAAIILQNWNSFLGLYFMLKNLISA